MTRLLLLEGSGSGGGRRTFRLLLHARVVLASVGTFLLLLAPAVSAQRPTHSASSLTLLLRAPAGSGSVVANLTLLLLLRLVQAGSAPRLTRLE